MCYQLAQPTPGICFLPDPSLYSVFMPNDGGGYGYMLASTIAWPFGATPTSLSPGMPISTALVPSGFAFYIDHKPKSLVYRIVVPSGLKCRGPLWAFISLGSEASITGA